MSIPLVTAGGLFTRFGHIGGILGVGTSLTNKDINDYTGNVVPAKVTQIDTDFAASPANQPLVDTIYSQLSSWQQAQTGFLQNMQQLMQQTLITMANQDTPLPQLSWQVAMNVLIQQMISASQTVKASVVATTPQTPVGTPNGNPTIILSTKDNNGFAMQYLFSETLNFSCISDSQSGAQLGQEPMLVQGAAQVGNPLSFNWPGGSGTNKQINCVTGLTSFPAGGGLGNSLVNSSFENFTIANVPDNWPIGVGTAGTDIFSSTTAYIGTKSLRFLGTGGAVLDSVSQQFNQSSGTSFQLKPNTQYAYKFWVQVPVTPTAGVLQVDLADTAVGGSLIGSNSKSVMLSTMTGATWTQFSGFFMTPATLPANQFLRIRLTTAIDSGKDVLIDSLALTPMTQLYTGGPWCAIFSNSNPLVVGDRWTMSITNTWGLFQRLFEKTFGMRANNFILPNSLSPTIPDSIIQ